MITAAITSEVVAIVLSPRDMPKVVELSKRDSKALKVDLDGKVYSDSGAGDWLGFYDWLRNSEGRIIGVQQWIDDVSGYPFSQNFVGVDADEKSMVVRAFFGQSREIDEATSCNQDFGDNRLLISGDSIALTFSTTAMK